MDLATIIGFILALVGIILGLVLEGGSVMELTQPTAFMIVMGGTIGATMISFPMGLFLEALKGLKDVIMPSSLDPDKIIEDLVQYSTKARKEGIISLEADVKQIKDPFLKKALMMAVDGADPKELRHTLESQLERIEEHGLTIPKVWESAGGYAPTIGIIGAVMGLIQVMKHLENIEEVGHGIAVAFVATIYGVGFANIGFIPFAGKMTLLHKKNMVIKEMILDGVLLVIEGVNPMIMRDKLSGFFVEKMHKPAEEKK